MHLPQYRLITDDFITYSFYSEGHKGKIEKIIQFLPIGLNHLYNLPLCNNNPSTGEMDDKVVTDNDDKDKVLATVIGALYVFCNQSPNAWIYAKGSTPAVPDFTKWE